MQFLHSRKYLNEGDVVEVNCSHQCNVRLTTDTQFSNFKNGRRHTYYGGFYERLPARITVPHTGYWNITIDLGGGSARITHSITIHSNS
ncbi:MULTISPECIES: DUF1883 domain-containing protein [Pseudomonas]|nr:MULTISPECIES: DUF1883 domain-containing protein [Pseudomonas]AGO40213.1 hypothetical protein M062_13470 [Pseudomonas aeruginosa RP73]ALY48133.1 hypothetical protein HW08_12250 [Pseudomonas aeruginosa]AYW43931.1 DUF1883 domain-containing protein [Pseudomonas aeruginosa]AYZ81642.1 DUF1883 domain-containing protein [Pseudomonas aeruginosa]AYZ87021.1 DUF1883 domain-containing protein [Pseudomonas aeruginosa]